MGKKKEPSKRERIIDKIREFIKETAKNPDLQYSLIAGMMMYELQHLPEDDEALENNPFWKWIQEEIGEE